MRISDWSSDVCSSDLWVRPRDTSPKSVSLPPLPRLRKLLGMHLAAQIGSPRAVIRRRRPLYHSQIGRASCRERVCQYVSISVVAGSLKKKKIETASMNAKRQKPHIEHRKHTIK